MEVIFQGEHSVEQAVDSLLSIIKLFKERYGIDGFREMQLNFTLLDEGGHDVELVDSQTSEVFRVFEVYSSELTPVNDDGEDIFKPNLKLVVDNTK